jgi:hypothetical protein
MLIAPVQEELWCRPRWIIFPYPKYCMAVMLVMFIVRCSKTLKRFHALHTELHY